MVQFTIGPMDENWKERIGANLVSRNMTMRAELAARVLFQTAPIYYGRPSLRSICFTRGFSGKNYGSKEWDRFYKLHNNKVLLMLLISFNFFRVLIVDVDFFYLAVFQG